MLRLTPYVSRSCGTGGICSPGSSSPEVIFSFRAAPVAVQGGSESRGTQSGWWAALCPAITVHAATAMGLRAAIEQAITSDGQA